MKIEVQIGRLLVEGVPLTRAQASQMGVSLEHELARLLADGVLPPEWRRNLAIRAVEAGEMQLSAENRPGKLGREIASTVHEALTGPIGNKRSR